jgi:hypothetical protein
MKKTAGLIEKLIRLANGVALPASNLKGEWFEQMLAEGILVSITHGSYKSFRVANADTFRHYLDSQYNIRDLEQTLQLLSEEKPNRALQVDVSGDSKFVRQRSFRGFLVNSYQPIEAILNGQSITICPPEGSFLFVSDYQHFSLAEDVVIVGIENAENFRYIRCQKQLFAAYEKVLFVSRYPQNGDLVRWLQSIPNNYVHFGDLDLAGIAIYQNEFYRHLGERSSFLIPEEYEERISSGNRERYDKQLPQYGKMKIQDQRIASVLSCIHRYHRGYDQEGFIVKN